MKEKTGGYEQIYLDLLKELAGFDLAANAPHLGLEADHKGRVTLNFLGRSYRVDNNGAKPVDGQPVGVNHLSLIVHYLMSPGRGEPSYSFLPLGRMTGMVEGRGAYDRDAVNTPLIRHFLGDLSALALAVMRLGGHPEGRGPSGALCWLFRSHSTGTPRGRRRIPPGFPPAVRHQGHQFHGIRSPGLPLRRLRRRNVPRRRSGRAAIGC